MKHIVIAPYLAHQSLIKKFRNDDVFSSTKFFTKESFLANVYYQYADDALLYLIDKYSLDYDVASQCLKIVSKLGDIESSNPKIVLLTKYKNELLANNLIYKNDYFDQELKDCEIEIYFYPDDDKELLNALINRRYKFINESGEVTSVVHHFHTNNEELSYIFNEIAHLISNGVPGNKIAIYGLSDTDELIFDRLKRNYRFHINNAYPKTLLDKIYVNRFLTRLLDLDIDSALEEISEVSKQDETFEEFLKNVNRFRVDKLAPKNQVEIYKEKFKNCKLKRLKYEDGIEVVNTPICPSDGYLFIVNMVQGKFPSIVRDNSYLSDKEKLEAKIVTSNDENSANYGLFYNYLKQKGHIYLSYSDSSFASKYYPSPFISNLNIKPDNENIQTDFYSFDEVQLSYANLLDFELNYLDRKDLLIKFRKTNGLAIPYRTYNPCIKAIHHYAFNQVIELSYSSVKSYYECAYKYYLSKVIKVDELEETFSIALGNLIHDVLEHAGDDDNFENIYLRAYERNADSFDKYDWVLLNRLKRDIERVFNYVREFERQVIDGDFQREFPFKIDLDEQVVLKGRIDKIVYSGQNENVAIIDYKSGGEVFNASLLPFGLSMQLPTYALFMSKLKEKSLISGLFIQTVLLDNKDSFDSRVNPSDLSKTYKLDGVMCDDIDAIKELDTSPEFRYIDHLTYKKDGSLKTNRMFGKDFFHHIASTANDLVIDAGHRILNNEFPINPKKINKQDKSCTYCPFKDVCYKDESMYINYTLATGDSGDGESDTSAN